MNKQDWFENLYGGPEGYAKRQKLDFLEMTMALLGSVALIYSIGTTIILIGLLTFIPEVVDGRVGTILGLAFIALLANMACGTVVEKYTKPEKQKMTDELLERLDAKDMFSDL